MEWTTITFFPPKNIHRVQLVCQFVLDAGEGADSDMVLNSRSGGGKATRMKSQSD